MSFDYLKSIWENSHKKVRAEGNYREIFSPAVSLLNDKTYLDFSSNDYLGLKNNREIIEAGYQNALRNGAGAGSSRLVLELDEMVFNLENYFAQQTHFCFSLFFPTGFIANVALFDVLAYFSWESNEKETIHYFIDHRSHASLFYGLKNAQLNFECFRHHDYENLRNKLQKSSAKVKIIVIESLYSIDGDFSDAEILHDICKKFNALIILDETHTLGTYTQARSWLRSHPLLKTYILAATYGCGKAVGVSGGFIATDHEVLKERIIQKCKYLIYSTAISPFITGAVKKSLEIIFSSRGEQIVRQLQNNIIYFRDKILEISNLENDFDLKMFDLQKHRSNIFSIVFKDQGNIKTKEKFFIRNGLILRALRPPTVPKGTSRFRVIIRANHTTEEMNTLIQYLK